MIFVRETRPKIVEELKERKSKSNVDDSFSVMKEVGHRWKTLTPQEKEIFEAKAQEDKKRYDKEMEVFNKEINKVNFLTHDDKKPGKAPSKKGKGKKSQMKAKNRKRNKRSTDTQADYYYPGKTSEPVVETKMPKNDYSLRKRNRSATKKYVEESEDEDLSDEEFDPKNHED
jgi:hypothetical protein